MGSNICQNGKSNKYETLYSASNKNSITKDIATLNYYMYCKVVKYVSIFAGKIQTMNVIQTLI